MTDKQREYQAQYRAKNKEKLAAYAKEYREANKAKAAEYSQAYYRENKEKYVAYERVRNSEDKAIYMKKYYEANKERLREYGRSWYRNNARLEREALLTEAAGSPRADFCEICGGFDINHYGIRTVYEHDHKTGKFRGWTCSACNKIIGFAKDNPNTLLKVIRYLEKRGYTFSECIEPNRAEVDACIDSLKDR